MLGVQNSRRDGGFRKVSVLLGGIGDLGTYSRIISQYYYCVNLVDVADETWNQLRNWVFEASEAILGLNSVEVTT